MRPGYDPAARFYKNDALLGSALARGLQTEVMAQAAMTGLSASPAAKAQAMAPAQTAAQQAQPQPMATPTAQAQPLSAKARTLPAKRANGAGFMREPNGPSIVALSLDGFDTHANQAATGQLATRPADFTRCSTASTPAWATPGRTRPSSSPPSSGRTARVERTGGTDHGTASTALGSLWAR